MLQAISTAAAMIESIADGDAAEPTFTLTDALTTAGLIAEALGETLDGYAAVGFELRTLVTDDFRENLAGQLQALATIPLGTAADRGSEKRPPRRYQGRDRRVSVHGPPLRFPRR